MVKQRQASVKSKLYSKQLRQTQKLAVQIKSGKVAIKHSQGHKSATMQFKSPKPHVQSKSRRSSRQFKSLDLRVQSKPKRSTRQFKSPDLRVQSKPKRSPSQFKLPGPIGRPNIYAPVARGISSPSIATPGRPKTIIEHPTLPPLAIEETPTQSVQVVTQSPHVDLSVQETYSSPSTGIDKRLVLVMAVACGLLMANIIYLQPLLANMGQSFAVSAKEIGLTAALGQLGYVVGLIFIVPLGERYNLRRLIVILLGTAAVAFVEMAMAPTVALLIMGSCAAFLGSIAPELIIPLAASLASPKERGRVVGSLFSGLFAGIPLAALLSGFVGKYLGWRAMFWIAAGLMITLAIVLHFVLPDSHSTKKRVSYPQLLGSLWKLLRSEPVLQEASVLAALVYGSFTTFWVTLSFVLQVAPYHYGSDIAGLFGLVGIAGATAALFVGKFADSRDARYATGATLALTLLAFVVMWLSGQWLIGLIISAVLLDMGAQSNLVANEIRIYSLDPTASIRLNTVHIFFYCMGGALGSALGTFSWTIAGRNGVYGSACGMLIVAVSFYVLHSKRMRQWKTRVGR
jgi:predicted MFS family arabinose efflux permease